MLDRDVWRDLGLGEHFEEAGGVEDGAEDGEKEDDGVEPGEPDEVKGVDVGLGHCGRVGNRWRDGNGVVVGLRFEDSSHKEGLSAALFALFI